MAEYPRTRKRIVIVTSVFMAMFLVTLDQNIISPATPKITDEFHSIGDIGWYGGAYLLSMCIFQLLAGKIYKFYPAKPIFLLCITVFEVGSVVCGSAQSSMAFIIGRAVQGIGSSGIYSGGMVIIFHTVPLQKRPKYQGFGGAVYALASVIGPVLGGIFTDKVTWRWCFYINLPVGALVMTSITIILHLPRQDLQEQNSPWVSKAKRFDLLGNLAFIPGVICLILALQWGGTEYSWGNARIIALLVLVGVLGVAFIGIQIWKKDDAMVPPRLVRQRSIAASLWFSVLNMSSAMVLTYYLPIWFQAVKGVSAMRSGILLIPQVLSTVITTILSGILVSKLGYYTQFFILSSILMSIAAGLLTTITPSTGDSQWIGYQILFGIGVGLGTQQPMNVVLTTLDEKDISTGSAVGMFTRFLGSAVFLPVAQNLFLSHLESKLTSLPNVDSRAVLEAGVTEIRNLATGNDLVTLISYYSDAVVIVFYLVVAMAAASITGSVLVEWRSLKTNATKGNETNGPAESPMAEASG